jgi:hypothetical protein
MSESERKSLEYQILTNAEQQEKELSQAGMSYDTARDKVSASRANLVEGVDESSTNKFSDMVKNATNTLDNSYQEYEAYIEELITRLENINEDGIEALQKEAAKKAEYFKNALGDDFEGSKTLTKMSQTYENNKELYADLPE